MSPRPFLIPPGARLLGFAGLLMLAGCGSTGPGSYAGARAQADRAAADAALEAAGGEPQTPALHLRLIEQMQRDGLWFASLAHLDALERDTPATATTLRLRADAQRRTGQIAESRQQYLRLLETPLAGPAYHGLGLLAGAEGDFAQAIEMLAQARQRDPTDVVVLSDLGYALLRAGRAAQARVPLMQASQLQPEQPQVQSNLALYLFAIRRGHEAEALMAARNLAPGTRHAIRQAARELPPMPTPARPGPPPAASSGTSSDLPAGMLAVSAPATSGASRHAPSAERPPSILTPSEAIAP